MTRDQRTFLMVAGAVGGFLAAVALMAAAVILWQQGTWLPAGLWIASLCVLAVSAFWTMEEGEGFETFHAFALIAALVATLVGACRLAPRVYWSTSEVTAVEDFEMYRDWYVEDVTDHGTGIYTMKLVLPQYTSARVKRFRIDEKTYRLIDAGPGKGMTLGSILKEAGDG